MPDTIYVHYGSTLYEPDMFVPIKNEPLWVKPNGGLWASRIGAGRGWKEWCESEKFCDCTEENSFYFTLKAGAHVAEVRTCTQLDALPHLESKMHVTWDLLDFETMLESGIDAIEVFMNDALYFRMYGWDCDSLLVLNKNIIVPMK